MSDLYDTDILLWSKRQADLLRRHAAGERLNSADLDWTNIAGEIDSMPPLPVPATCPVTLKELLAPPPEEIE